MQVPSAKAAQSSGRAEAQGGQFQAELILPGRRRCRTATLSASAPVSVRRAKMLHCPRGTSEPYTICTATAPEAVLTVRTSPARRDEPLLQSCAVHWSPPAKLQATALRLSEPGLGGRSLTSTRLTSVSDPFRTAGQRRRQHGPAGAASGGQSAAVPGRRRLRRPARGR
jgi:hypothetical protein